MMWLNGLLVLFLSFDQSTYWKVVRALNEQGCHVYSYIYTSCPNKTVPYGMEPIGNAVETLPVGVLPSRQGRSLN